MTWQGAEMLVARLVEGEVVTEKDEQLRDIDVRCGKDTYSVKYQPAAAKYRNISFEMELLDEAGNTMPGNFARCEAGKCVVVIPWSAELEVLCWDTRGLKWWLAKQKYPLKGLTGAAVATNGGRKFKYANNLIVPIDHLRPLVDWRVVETPGHA